MYYDGPPGMTLDLVGPSPDGVDLEWRHPFSEAAPYRRVASRKPSHAYAYGANNPVRYVDPSGLKEVCGFYVWLYTGLGWCVDESVWNAAMNAAGEVVTCWWNCEVKTHKTVCGKVLVGTEVISGVVGGIGARIPKAPGEIFIPGDIYKSLFRDLVKKFGTREAEMIMRAIERSKGVSAAKGTFVAAVLIEAGISINCSWHCS